MYWIVGVILLICILFLTLQVFRRKRIICRICEMELCSKLCLLNEILQPFGFSYDGQQKVVTTKRDAWQRKYGYSSVFDRSALRFGMVFDCETCFFHCQGRTYRIEMWKGQYGLNLGAEVGVYYTEGILEDTMFDTAHFQSVSDSELLDIGMKLYQKGQEVFQIKERHWWLGGFMVGRYCEPEDLQLEVSITFPDMEMLTQFTESIVHIGCHGCDVVVCGLTVRLCFAFSCTKQMCRPCSLRVSLKQWKNRMFCRLYQFATRPFTCTHDRILFLYFFLPPVFRRLCRCKKNRRQKMKRAVRS